VHLSFKIESDSTWVEGDRKWLRILISELISNGIKVTPEKLTVSTRLYKKNHEVIVRVSNKGHLISSGSIDKIFYPFYCAISSKRHLAEDGNGLYLTLAKYIARSHNGRIWAKSSYSGRDGLRVFVAFPSSTKGNKGE